VTHYLRFVSTPDHRAFDAEAEAIKEAQTVISRQRGFPGRVAHYDGETIVIHDRNGQLVDGFWVEDENGQKLHIPMP